MSKLSKIISGFVLPSLGVLVAVIAYLGQSRNPSSGNITASSSPVVSGVSGGSVQQTTNYYGEKEPEPGSTAAALKQLKDRGLAFTVPAFEETADSSSPDVIALYLQAGMSPNAVGYNTDLFVLSEAIANNPGDKGAIVRLFKNFGLNFKVVNKKNHLPYI